MFRWRRRAHQSAQARFSLMLALYQINSKTSAVKYPLVSLKHCDPPPWPVRKLVCARNVVILTERLKSVSDSTL